MRKAGWFISAIIAIMATACSENQFSELDRLLEQKEEIEAAVKRKTDSLRLSFEATPSQNISAKWEKAELLYEEWRHLNLDSCSLYTNEMLRYAGDDPSRILRSKAALVRTLVRAEEMFEADSVFKSIVLPQNVSQKDLDAYFYCADRLTNYLPAEYRKAFGPNVEELSAEYIRRDSSSIKAQLFKVKALRYSGKFEQALSLIKSLPVNEMTDIYDISTCYFVTCSLSLQLGYNEDALAYAIKASCVDLSCGMKDYASLYTLAQILFRDKKSVTRAGRYMNRAVEDAAEYNFPIGIRRSARAMTIMNNAIQDMNHSRRILLTAGIIILSFFLAVALFLLFFSQKMLGRVRQINRMYKSSQHKLQNVSLIKDKMLGEYMELSSKYIYKVDENRSRYRKILKEKGADALMAIFREPAFADGEFPHYWNNFDKIFLSIFPDFVNKLNNLMKPENKFTTDSPGSLTTELRILALIRLDITESKRISVILHVSKGTVYTYRSIMRQNSLDPDNFEDNVRKIEDF